MTEREPTVEEIREALADAGSLNAGAADDAHIWMKYQAFTLARMALRAAEAEARAERMKFERDAYMKGMGDIAASIPLPDILAATGSVGDMIAYIKDRLATPRPASPSPATVEAMAEALERIASMRVVDVSADPAKPFAIAHGPLAAYRKEMSE